MKIKYSTSHTLITLFAAATFAAGCGSKGGSSSSCTAAAPAVSGANVMSITVNGSQCSGANNYLNEPCASVTICSPGTSTCQTINNILLDTGSYGLRIFSSVLTVPLTQEMSGNSVVECAQFGSGNTWGPVQTADVYLGGEGVLSSLPIQVINSSYNSTWLSSAGIPCSSTRDSSPASSGYNGILGVGLSQIDCPSCTGSTSPNAYFTCVAGSTCTASTMTTILQVHNPIANLASDNNGVVLELPAVPSACSTSGAQSLSGYLVMGIGTSSNNTPSGVTYFPANGSNEFTVTYGGTSYSQSFIDSGSNGLFFPGNVSPNNIPVCGSPYTAWLCPGSGVLYNGTAVNKGSGGTPTGSVSFQVEQATDLFNSGNAVFMNLGGTMTQFDWGLPFYMGRNVYSTINGKTSTLGTSPGWAY